MIPLDEARQHVLDRVRPLAPVATHLTRSQGLVLAGDLVSTESVPPFANTAMDGFAVVAADTIGAPVTLDVVATIAAGSSERPLVGPGQAARIMTGAPMPPGADAVVMVERTSFDPESSTVEVEIEVKPGNSVRGAGEDIQPGDLVFAAGTCLRPGHVGVLASIGAVDPLVHPRPRVGVISTGDELVEGDGPLRPGQIRDSNRLTLLGLVRESGFEGIDLGLVADSEHDITEAFLSGAKSCDAIISSGGVSMGAFDYVKVVLDKIADMRWMQIAIKPAKPFAFGMLGNTPFFGLPGNPVSSMVSFELLARPALRKMAGHSHLHRQMVPAISESELGHADDGKTHFVRMSGSPDQQGRWQVSIAGGQGSHQLTAMARADALAVLPDGVSVPAGGECSIIPLT